MAAVRTLARLLQKQQHLLRSVPHECRVAAELCVAVRESSAGCSNGTRHRYFTNDSNSEGPPTNRNVAVAAPAQVGVQQTSPEEEATVEGGRKGAPGTAEELEGSQAGEGPQAGAVQATVDAPNGQRPTAVREGTRGKIPPVGRNHNVAKVNKGEPDERAGRTEDKGEGTINFDMDNFMKQTALRQRGLAPMELGWKLDPEGPHKKGRKPKRSQLGSWKEYDEDLAEELKRASVKVPEPIPLYDPSRIMEELKEGENEDNPIAKELLGLLEAMQSKNPETRRDVMDLTVSIREDPPRPYARPIIRWEVRAVLVPGDLATHPKNKKAKLRVYLRDLQAETGLSEAALQHIARICERRYDPETGELTLTADKYFNREENRLHALQQLRSLVSEGHRAFPNPDPGAQEVWARLQSERRQRAPWCPPRDFREDADRDAGYPSDEDEYWEDEEGEAVEAAAETTDDASEGAGRQRRARV